MLGVEIFLALIFVLIQRFNFYKNIVNLLAPLAQLVRATDS